MCDMRHKALGGYHEIMLPITTDCKQQVGIVHEKLKEANRQLAQEKSEQKKEA